MIEYIARRTPSCQEMARLLSESMDRSLPWTFRIKAHLHLLICQGCREYRAQLRTLRRSMRQQAVQGTAPSLPSEQAREQLKDAFRSRRS